MRPDPLDTFRAALVESFRQVLPDPSAAEWLADLVIEKIRFELAGQHIPALSRSETRRREARVLELLRQGIPVSVICKRLGVVPSTVYRAQERARKRLRAA